MGLRLIREVLDHAPGDLTSGELVVLLVLAEYARDDTRECWPGMDNIARRARIHPDTVRKIFVRWAGRVPPMDVRVAIGKTRDGRPLYAARGHRTVYRVPILDPKGGTFVPTFPRESPDVRAGKGRTFEPESPDVRAYPSSHEPSLNRQISRASAPSALAAIGADERETEILIEKIKTERRPRSLNGYVAKLAENGDLANLLAEVRSEQQRRADDESYRRGWVCHRCRNRNRQDATACRQCGTERAA